MNSHFLIPPRSEAIRDGFKTLFELGAVNERRQLTPLGKSLARMPVDPRIGRMIFAADDENCLSEILIIAAALELQDPRVRPPERRQAADTQHEKFRNEKSDFLSLLKLWDYFHQLKGDLSRAKLKLACQQNFLSYSLMRQWQDIHRQLRSMASDQNLKTRSRKDDYNAIHRSLLSGLLSGVALAGDRHEYTGAGNVKFHLWPGSGIFESKPQWIVAAELVETSRRYGRTIAKISPEWIEPLAKHLVKRRYSDAHWSKKKQTVLASEHVTLFGLPIVAGRLTNYTKIDPEMSRDLFIERGLAGDEFEGSQNFYQHNRWLLEEVKSEAAKTRDRELIVNNDDIINFYQDKLPESAVDGFSLNKLIKDSPELDQRLRMTRADLLPSSEIVDVGQQFPDQVQVGSMQIPIQYRFSPGAKDDGATIKLPLEGVGQLDDTQTGWLIPGLLETRIISLIRSLPKSVRRNLVPAPDTAKRVAKDINFGQGIFHNAVARELSKIGGIPITSELFKTEKMDDHLKVNMQVVDEAGEVVAEGRSIAEIRGQLGDEFKSNIVEIEDSHWNRDGLQEWCWEDFPKEITIQRGATQLASYPAILDQNDGIGLRLTDSTNASDQTTRQGLVRLFQITNRKPIKSQVNWLPELDRHAVSLSKVIPAGELKNQLADLIARIAFVDRNKIPRSRDEYNSLQSNAVERISIASQSIAKWLPKLAVAAHELQLQLESLSTRYTSTQNDISLQVTELKSDCFLSKTPWTWLEQFPRYFEAMSYRMEKLDSTATEKDQTYTEEISHHWERYCSERALHLNHGIVDPELETYRWMIEELRVSLFAQPLGTIIKISPQRMEKQWKRIRHV
ncbi:ATP-dependent RNA helicase HrpA [Mariniblastus sp.]|nr:ATP-dependent RNA helicase HrpA [Mariniblastus sp.]